MSSNKKLSRTDIKDRDNNISATKLEVSHYKGMLPPKEVVEVYENLQPGSVDRILKLIETQVNNRVENETKLVEASKYTAKAEIFYNIVGLIIISFIISMILVFGFILAYYKGQYTLLTTGVIATILGAFVKIFSKK